MPGFSRILLGNPFPGKASLSSRRQFVEIMIHDWQSQRTGRHEQSQCCCYRRGKLHRGKRRENRSKPFSSSLDAARIVLLRRGTRKPCERQILNNLYSCTIWLKFSQARSPITMDTWPMINTRKVFFTWWLSPFHWQLQFCDLKTKCIFTIFYGFSRLIIFFIWPFSLMIVCNFIFQWQYFITTGHISF